jgi:hypothetical protein
MTPEHRVMNEIRLWCGEHGIPCFRANVGTFETKDGQYVSTGLPKGFPDLIALLDGGRTLFIECKARYGYQSPEQKAFQKMVQDKGFIYIVAKSPDDVERYCL